MPPYQHELAVVVMEEWHNGHTELIRTSSAGGSHFEFITGVAPFHELHSNLTLALVGVAVVAVVEGVFSSLSQSKHVGIALWI